MWAYRTLTISILSVLLLAGSAWAQTEINHAKAIAGGVTPGDAPGYPVTLSLSGSYKLTGILSVPNANTSAIVITANYVTLDLNGFLIHGPTVCTSSPGFLTTCSPTGLGVGVHAVNKRGIMVRNGQIFGMGSDGIAAGGDSQVTQVSVRSNGGNGINIGAHTLVTECTANSNGGAGIFAYTVTNSTADFNSDVGIGAQTATNNTASYNGVGGINTYTATNNTATSNVGYGITAITTTNNTASFNSGYGLIVSGSGGYANNVVNSNNGGNTNPQVSGGIQMGTNICGGDTTCP